MGFVLWEIEGPPECLEDVGCIFEVSFGSVFGAGGSGGVGVFSLVVDGGGGVGCFFLRRWWRH